MDKAERQTILLAELEKTYKVGAPLMRRLEQIRFYNLAIPPLLIQRIYSIGKLQEILGKELESLK